jgi:hypothetical protein
MNIERMGEQKKKRSFVIVPYIGSEGHPVRVGHLHPTPPPIPRTLVFDDVCTF